MWDHKYSPKRVFKKIMKFGLINPQRDVMGMRHKSTNTEAKFGMLPPGNRPAPMDGSAVGLVAKILKARWSQQFLINRKKGDCEIGKHKSVPSRFHIQQIQ